MDFAGYSVSAAVGLGGLGDLLRWTLGRRGAVFVGLVLGAVAEDDGLAKSSETEFQVVKALS